MNIQGNIRKIIVAIKQKGKEIKIDTRMFYLEEANKYITKIIFSEKRIEKNKKGKEVSKWCELYSGYSKVKLLKYLVEYYKEIEGEANG